MAVSIQRVFWIGAVLSALALMVALFLPRERAGEDETEEIHLSADCGERLIMAEQTTINKRNQPKASVD